MCKCWNQVSLVVAEHEKGGKSDAFIIWFLPLADFFELGRVGVDTAFGHDSAEIVNGFSKK